MSHPFKNKQKVVTASKTRIKKHHLDNDIFNKSKCRFNINEDDSQTTSKVHINAMTKLIKTSKIWLKNKRPLTYTEKISINVLSTIELPKNYKIENEEDVKEDNSLKIITKELHEDIDKPSFSVLKLCFQAMLQYFNFLDKK
ncbi:15815_t:CDS:2 [Cetraspora pellucida]|uniref:15815_t:CDS:1 n=1 Tax=Cetraspora pellucida TaxID=1433469 RepID=A0A9N8VSZ5_9GLOM|nr:15815_t:CDS:2 [Cetraspora pellucida]